MTASNRVRRFMSAFAPAFLSASVSLAIVIWLAGPAVAQTDGPTPPASPPSPPLSLWGGGGEQPSSSRTLGLTVGFGIRSDLIRSTGLDPFSTTDSVPQSALSVSYGGNSRERFGLGVGLEWDHGESTSSARGAETTLTIDRLSFTLEGRLSLARRLVLLGRLAPGLLRDKATVLDGSTPPGAFDAAPASLGLQQTSWVAAGDVSGGLAFRFADIRPTGGPAFGVWLTAEAGYGYSAAHDLVLRPQVETQPGRVDEPVNLGRLAFGGPFFRARIALSF